MMSTTPKNSRKFVVKQPNREYLIVITNEYLNITEHRFPTLFDLMRALPEHMEAVKNAEGIGLAITAVTGRGDLEHLCQLDAMSKQPLSISGNGYLVMDYEL